MSDVMQLSTIWRGLCRVVLAFVHKLNPHMHYSFGDKVQSAHICVPLTQAMDRIVRTPAGQTPPQIGALFSSSLVSNRLSRALNFLRLWRACGCACVGVQMFPEHLSRIKKQASVFEVFDSSTTYSMSFHSANLDLSNWQAVNIPGASTVELTKLWRNMPLHLVAYMLQAPSADDSALSPNAPHTADAKKYFFNLEVRNVHVHGTGAA